ncbi:hypothetical protein PFISCL1PPCAC_4589, partial [Pristionchus fissidentatus]
IPSGYPGDLMILKLQLIQSKEPIKKREKASNTGKEATKKADKKKSVDDVSGPRIKTDKDKREKGGESKLSEAKQNENRKKWSTRVHGLNCRDMSKEFNAKIKRYIPEGVTMDIGHSEANQLKCRYADVLCIDQTRVPLKGRPKDDDFIHANWVGAPGGTKYICTQAPLKETTEEFWHMCYKEKASLILMLCDFKEGSDLEKCSHYFPEKPKEKKKAGDYTITMKEKLDEIEIEDTDFSMMEIKYKDSDSVKVKHCFMRYWVDNCAPVETEPILKLWRWVRKHHADRPVVVHCSAGVGRTSTFVGIELASHRIAANPDLHLLDVVKELRKMRYQSIQSHVQFLYLHCLVLDFFVQEKIAEPYKNSDSKFVEEYRKHTTKRTTRAKKQAAKQGAPETTGGKG